MALNAATAYQINKVNTATPEELTLMLYDGVVKFCNIAIIGIESNDITKAHTNIVKAQKIVAYLQSTLDLKYEVSKDFNNVYNYVYERLVHANLKKDKVVIEEILEHIRVLRDTWKEVMKTK